MYFSLYFTGQKTIKQSPRTPNQISRIEQFFGNIHIFTREKLLFVLHKYDFFSRKFANVQFFL